ncbi:DNA methyltransferase [Azospirillum largimobile]
MKHPLHAICPYFAMFPEDFVLTQLLAYSMPGDLVLDPFSGRGTTVLEALLNRRRVIATDINPVAACVSGAKAECPPFKLVEERINNLESQMKDKNETKASPSPFFDVCYHPSTLQEILFLRECLEWTIDPVDRFIAAVVLGALHGESHRSELCLSNRMPRTISTKPEYSMRWWQKHGYIAPMRSTFDVLRRNINMRYASLPPQAHGKVVLGDARNCSEIFKSEKGKVSLAVTSPPYIDTTDYSEDQWLRLWFLGGDSRPVTRLNSDDRHTNKENYWSFLQEVWEGCADLMARESHIVMRIGGKLTGDELFDGVHTTLSAAFGSHRLITKHRTSSKIKKRQTNAFRPGTSDDRAEHDFVFFLQ